MRSSRLALILITAATVTATLAGCIAAPDAPGGSGDVSTHGSSAAGNDAMTADESVKEDEGVNAGAPAAFYAEREHTITGRIVLSALPVDLALENGRIAVTAGPEGTWRLVAAIRGYGSSPEEARANRDAQAFTWTINGDDGGYHLRAEVEREKDPLAGLLRLGSHGDAQFTLEMPASLVMDLEARATNGGITLEGIRGSEIAVETTNGRVEIEGVTTDALRAGSTNGGIDASGLIARVLTLQSTNGAIDVDASGTETVRLGTTNAAVDAHLDPSASGTITAVTTNGRLHIAVPEDAAHGYRANAQTTNGNAEIRLTDGSTRSNGENSAHFESSGFDGRAIRVLVDLQSTNGDVELVPA